MKTVFRLLIVLMLVAGVFLPMSIARAKETRIDFSGREWCDPSTLVIGREYWNGNDYHARGISQICYDFATIPQMTGTGHLFNSRMDAFDNFTTMKMSGHSRMVTIEGGEWLSTWILPRGSDTITLVAVGHGKYNGLTLHMFLSFLDNSFYGYITGLGE